MTQRAVPLPEPSQPLCRPISEEFSNPGDFPSGSYRSLTQVAQALHLSIPGGEVFSLLVLSSALSAGGFRESANARILSKKRPFTSCIACAASVRAGVMRSSIKRFVFTTRLCRSRSTGTYTRFHYTGFSELNRLARISWPTTGVRIIGGTRCWNKVNRRRFRKYRSLELLAFHPANSIGTKFACEQKQTASVLRIRWKKGDCNEHTAAVRSVHRSLNSRTLGCPHPGSPRTLRRVQPLVGRGIG